MKQATNNQNLVRRRLRVLLKLMLLVALGWVLVVSVGQFGNESEKVVTNTLRVDLSDLMPGQEIRLDWDGRPVLVLHRTPEQIEELQNIDLRLVHIAGNSSDLRSQRSEFFVAIAVGTDFGCQLTYHHDTTGGGSLTSWFEDVCRRSRYDLAGRVLRGHYAMENLVIPDYAIEEGLLILGRKPGD